MKRMSASFLTLALVLGGIGQAKADLGLTFSGTIFQPVGSTLGNNLAVAVAAGAFSPIPVAGQPNVGSDATLLAAGATHANFITTSINYNSTNTGYTAQTFLNPVGGFTGPTSGFSGSTSLDNNYIYLTATTSATVGQRFTFTTSHDDGINLVVNGTSLVQTPVPGFGETYQYTATSNGPLTIQLAYGETHGQPAILSLSVTATPEPATLTMAGCGLVALGGYKLRRKRVVA